MRPSEKRHPVAVLREICDLRQTEFADLIGCSPVYLQKIEATPAKKGGLPLSPKLAQRIFHETGVSLEWLRKGDPKAPPVSARGERYTRDIFVRAQAEKKYYDRPHPWFQNNDALRCCARVVAILQSAAERGQYYMAMYELGAALDKLAREEKFGQKPGTEFTNKQVDLIKPLIEQGKNPIAAAHRFNAALRRSKRPSKKVRRRS
jgi:hypothetical protein